MSFNKCRVSGGITGKLLFCNHHGKEWMLNLGGKFDEEQVICMVLLSPKIIDWLQGYKQ